VEKPESPNDVGDVCVQAEEEHGQGVTLRLIERGQEGSAVPRARAAISFNTLRKVMGTESRTKATMRDAWSGSPRSANGTEP
jgi:hypothetical protein